MKTRNFRFTFFLAGLIIFSASQSMAQHHCCNSNWSANANAQWWNYNTPAEYALSAEQITEINKLRKNSYEKKLPIENELRSLRMEYQAANSSSELDVEKLKSLRSSIRDKEEKIDDINLETKVQVRRLLTEKQLTYFNNNNYSWWDMSENCWNAGNSDMKSRRQMMMSRRNNCW
ncbi:MAG: periplasmic heavy metal sensor [Bacteroidales bacterium]|nr:periplasmic heavy metal sensor [Bacteroidales bacterium]